MAMQGKVHPATSAEDDGTESEREAEIGDVNVGRMRRLMTKLTTRAKGMSKAEKYAAGCCLCSTFFSGLVIAILVLAMGVYGGDRVTTVKPFDQCVCNRAGENLIENVDDVPSQFKIDAMCPKYNDEEKYDPSPFYTDNVSTIYIHPRGEENIRIAAYLYPAEGGRNTNGETIVLTNGFGASRTKYTLLIPAAMLQKMGFNVVSIDVRSHGDSDPYLDRRTTWGYLEHKDTLGAWDWAVEHLAGGDTSRVGIEGASLGGLISEIAFGMERRIPGVFLDSPVRSLSTVLKVATKQMGFNARLFLASCLHFAEQAVNVKIRNRAPSKVLPGGSRDFYDPSRARKIAITSGLEDETVPWNNHGRNFVDMVRELGYNVTHIWTESTLDEGEACGGCYSPPYVRTSGQNCKDENEHVRQMLRWPGTYRRMLCVFWSDVFGRDIADCGLERFSDEETSSEYAP